MLFGNRLMAHRVHWFTRVAGMPEGGLGQGGRGDSPFGQSFGSGLGPGGNSGFPPGMVVRARVVLRPQVLRVTEAEVVVHLRRAVAAVEMGLRSSSASPTLWQWLL